MLINELIEQKNLTKYSLSKSSGIPYTTVNDICRGRARLEKCSAETIYRLSKELGVSMEVLLEPCFVKRTSFEIFKSNVCHRIKALGDVDFILETLEKDDIRKYHQRKWYPESLYLLAMLDYLSRINNLPLCSKYHDLRRCKLSEAIYPASVLAASAVAKDERFKEQSRRDSIPEFLRFNIIEGDVRNVV